MGPPLWLGDALRAWLFVELLPFFAVAAARPEVFVSTGSNWESTRLLVGKIGQSFDCSDAAVLSDFTR